MIARVIVLPFSLRQRFRVVIAQPLKRKGIHQYIQQTGYHAQQIPHYEI
jgi:hypothetical protein